MSPSKLFGALGRAKTSRVANDSLFFYGNKVMRELLVAWLYE